MIPKTAAYGSGILYPPNLTDSLSETLKSSGIETLILWAFHIHTSGDIIFNDTKIITYDSNVGESKYVADDHWPSRLHGLIESGSTITQLAASIGGWATDDFLHIKQIYESNNNSFDNTALKSNFKLFKKKFPSVTLIDLDVEGPDVMNYDQTSFVAFCKMLIGIGFDITFCPYAEQDFWTGSLNALNQSNPGAVRWWNLQCYAGGAGNDATTWASYITVAIPGFKTDGYILVSDWSRFYNTVEKVWQGDCVPAFNEFMSGYKSESSVAGGFLWNIDQVEGYADAIKREKDPHECSSSDRSLADYISAIKGGLGH
jgi:hypothetical protein